jgi:hypothetical protein
MAGLAANLLLGFVREVLESGYWKDSLNQECSHTQALQYSNTPLLQYSMSTTKTRLRALP